MIFEQSDQTEERQTGCYNTPADCGSAPGWYNYITLHKIDFRVPKINRTARTLCEIKGVMWEGVQLWGKTYREK